MYRSYENILSPVAVHDENLPDIPQAMLVDAYAGLSEFAGDMDYELARMLIQSVNEYKLPPADRERFDRLQEGLSRMDWDGIREIL